MHWQKDLARVSWSLSHHEVDDLLLWDAEEDRFDDASPEFWNEIMPHAHGVKCVPFNYKNFDFYW